MTRVQLYQDQRAGAGDQASKIDKSKKLAPAILKRI
jgi:hypothetical protein